MNQSTTTMMLAALFGLAATAGCTAADLPSTGSDSAALADVAASDCSVTNEFGTAFVTGTVKITNSTDRAQTYTATISVNDATGSRVGEINVFSNSLGARQSTTLSGAQATGNATQGAKPGPATCAVANVTRLPQ
jgi:hypothetical protein